MPDTLLSALTEPARIANSQGLMFTFNRNGSIQRIDCGPLMLNLFLGNELEGGVANLYLRRHGATLEVIPLLGPRSPAQFTVTADGIQAHGTWQDLRFALHLVLSATANAWFWHVELHNTGRDTLTVDLVYAQDLGLAQYSFIRMNEFFCSHYIDHCAFTHAVHGQVVASRQNLQIEERHPWTLIGSLGSAVSYATDALQLHGLATRAGDLPAGLRAGLPGARHQHEHSLVALQDAVVSLTPGSTLTRGFFGWFEADHPAASSAADLHIVARARALPEAQPPSSLTPVSRALNTATLFSAAPLFMAAELTDTELARQVGSDWRHVERHAGQLWSFFSAQNNHVVLAAKERQVLRPHVQILRSGAALTPEESALTSTTWMAGGFNSLLTQGHVAINRLLSTVRGYLSLFRASGQRIFVEMGDAWHLLDIPSAFVMSPQCSQWIYHHAALELTITTTALTHAHCIRLEIEIRRGPPRRFLISNQIALDGDDGASLGVAHIEHAGEVVTIYPPPSAEVGQRFPQGCFTFTPAAGTIFERVGGDELLFVDGQSRAQPFLCLLSAPAHRIGCSIEGHLVTTPALPAARGLVKTPLRLTPPAASPLGPEIARWTTLFPWFIDNALVHYLAPRGPEQFTGGNWGTRDICQGPLEMLLALGQWEAARDLVCRVFRAQNPGGDWPQWFSFFDRERNLRADHAHGDIIFWPLLGLARYFACAEDWALLDEPLPFFHATDEAPGAQASVWEHVERALAVIETQLIAGTALVAYGLGDWNDSMQPADPAFRARLCSSWTVILHYQALTLLGTALQRGGRETPAAHLTALAARVRESFEQYLIVDGLIAGYAHFGAADEVEFLLHPRDDKTGVHGSLLPIPHAVLSDLLTADAATDHLAHISAHLLGPDGARLFERPMTYRGGPQQYFQRAETAAFFGREIGLMYTHSHLRYAEALAHHGRAEEFFAALCKVNPIAVGERTPSATPRQANCYYSSSDAAFRDRYQAATDYDQIATGEIALDGGWRVYSSGPGLTVALLIRCLLGLEIAKSVLRFDPVLPKALHGLEAELEILGRGCQIRYEIEAVGVGPRTILLNDIEVPFQRLFNPYRLGGAEVTLAAILPQLHAGANRWCIKLW